MDYSDFFVGLLVRNNAIKFHIIDSNWFQGLNFQNLLREEKTNERIHTKMVISDQNGGLFVGLLMPETAKWKFGRQVTLQERILKTIRRPLKMTKLIVKWQIHTKMAHKMKLTSGANFQRIPRSAIDCIRFVKYVF